ncbi:MAG TPA: TIGR02996 domain-containing protein [Kofleriaceae bacterium]|jgi:uncharacterized protein (TIGR02996 family)
MTLEALLAAVYAHPDDIAARLVYADALADAGDPRGEFIARQCRGDEARDLLAVHRNRWLGALAPILHPKGSEFVNGFLTTARVRDETPAKLRNAVGDPVWSTVVEIDFVRGEAGPANAIIKSPVMCTLYTVYNLESDAFAALCSSARPLPLRTITAHASPYFERLDDTSSTELATAIEHAPGLPALRHLVLTADSHLYHPPYLRWLLASQLVGRLELLELEGFGGNDPDWADVVRDAHPGLGRLVINNIRVPRDEHGRLAIR